MGFPLRDCPVDFPSALMNAVCNSLSVSDNEDHCKILPKINLVCHHAILGSGSGQIPIPEQ